MFEPEPSEAVQDTTPTGPALADEPVIPLPDAESGARPQESAMQQCLTHFLTWQSQFAPPTDATAAPVDVQPAQTPDGVPVSSLPVPADAPATDTTNAPPSVQPIDAAPTPQGLTLRNALENGGPVSFLVNGRVYELLPGEAHEFSTGESWDVQFHRGESLGNEQRLLSRGIYRFVVTDRGWDLEAVAP